MLLDGADHLVSDPADARSIAALISISAARYVVATPTRTVKTLSLRTSPEPGRDQAGRSAGLRPSRSRTPTHAWLLDEAGRISGASHRSLGPAPRGPRCLHLDDGAIVRRRKGGTSVGRGTGYRRDHVHAATAPTPTTSGQVDMIDQGSTARSARPRRRTGAAGHHGQVPGPPHPHRECGSVRPRPDVVRATIAGCGASFGDWFWDSAGSS